MIKSFGNVLLKMPNKRASVSACVCVCVFYHKFRVQQTGTTLVKKKNGKKKYGGHS